MFRAFGIATALLMPVAVLALGAGTAGATTQSTVNVKATFTFTTPGGVNTLHCPTTGTFPQKKLVTGNTVQIKGLKSTATGTQIKCAVATGGPTHTGIPKTSTIHLLIMAHTPGWLLYKTSTPRTGTIKANTLVIKIKFSNTATCHISFPTPIDVMINSGLTKATITSTPTSGATITGTTATCGALRSLLHTSSSSFSGSVSGI
jgi:hypothetical protein